MLFRSVAKCSAYGTNAMHCTSKHRRCDTTTALVREIPETLSSPPMAKAYGSFTVSHLPAAKVRC